MHPLACSEEIFWIALIKHTSQLTTPPDMFGPILSQVSQPELQERGQARHCITLLHIIFHSFFLPIFPLIQCVNRAVRQCVTHRHNGLHCLYKTKMFSPLLGITCGMHPSIEKAEVISTGSTYRSNVTFVCNSGYHLVGPQNITCLANGSWSKPLPLCEGNCLVSWPGRFRSGISNSSSLMHAYHMIQALSCFWETIL